MFFLLNSWIILLNAALTVEAGNAGSHIEKWAPFTEELISWLSNKYELVWMLWGSDAQAYEGDIKRKDKQRIIKTSHPVPMSAYKSFNGNSAFIGSGCFKQVPGIDWSI